METKGKRGAEIRRRKPDSRNSETQHWGFDGRRRCQISHREEFEKANLGVTSSLYPLIVRNARSGDERTRPDQSQSNQNPTTSDQIKPNPTKKNGPARIKAQAVGSTLARTNLDFGRARWMRGNAERINGQAKDLSDRNIFIT